MANCTSCGKLVPTDTDECEYCGAPQPSGSSTAKRHTVAEGTSAEAVQQPKKRRTIIAGDTLEDSVHGASTGVADPNDPFAAALRGRVSPPAAPAPQHPPAGKRVTIIESDDGGRGATKPAPLSGPVSLGSPAPVDPNDPFRIAAEQAPQRALGGMLITFSPCAAKQLFPLIEGKNLIGRAGDPGLDVELKDDRVSSPHCSIIVRRSGVLLKDDGSTNGTWHRRGDTAEFEDILNTMVQLHDDDLVKVGGTVFLVKILDRDLIQRIWPGR